MPINFNDLTLNTAFLEVDANASIGEIYQLLPKDSRDALAFGYVVAPLGDGRYLVARWVEIEEFARHASPVVVRGMRLADLADMDAPAGPPAPGGYPKLAEYTFADLQRLLTPAEGVEKSTTTTQQARDLRNSHPGRRVVVLDGGQVIGLLTVELLSGDTLGADPFKRGGVRLTADDPPPDRIADTLPPEAGPPPDGEAKAGEERTFNYWLAELDEQGNTTAITDKRKPLRAGLVYELKLNLSKPRADAIATGSAEQVAEAEQGMAPDRTTYDILVVLESSDFTLYGSKEQTLTVARGGFSKNTIAFAFEATKEGVGKATALFFVDGVCFQQTEFALQVGGRPAKDKDALTITQSRGKTMASAMKSAAKEAPLAGQEPVNLVILPDGVNYRFILSGAGVTRATIKVSMESFAQQVKDARATLLKIVNREHNGEPVYQSEVLKIPDTVHQETLKQLAREGFMLYRRLFYGQGPDAEAMGNLLKLLSQGRSLHVAVIAEGFIFPWALLFDGDPKAEKIDPQGFWGFKHVIEYMPEFSVATPINFVPQIESGPKLPVAFICNTAIDQQLVQGGYPPVIEPQLKHFESLKQVDLTKLTTAAEMFALMKSEQVPPLIYINCHAISYIPGDASSAFASKLQLSEGEISVDELDFEVPLGEVQMKSGPLVFINACQSAELSPYLYAGLVPAMIQRGARGVIGTEVDTPALFAADFAKKFVERFSAGTTPLGQLLLELRLEYLKQNNVMGLVYALYSSGEVIVRRAG